MPAAIRYATILAATDLSETGNAAVVHAIDLARRLGARLEVVFNMETMDPTLPWNAENHEAVDALHAAAREAAGQALAELVGEPEGMEVGLEVLEGGAPHQDIVDFAKRCRADLVVVGARGKSLDRLLGGSTAVNVMRTSPVPVLVVPGMDAR